MSHQCKLLFSLLTALAVIPLMATSDTPSSSSSSSLMAHTSLDTPASKIPTWYYASPFFKLTFEQLNYVDLTTARSVSKAFHAMAPQVLMPTGQKWVAQFMRRFARAKTATEKYNAYRDIISAAGRCPNAIAELEEIVNGYYIHVPEELCFWDGEREPVTAKDDLRNELGTILDEIEKVKAERQCNFLAVKQQAPQANVDREIEELSSRYEQILRPLKQKQAEIVGALMPALRALCPYTTASIMVEELNGNQLLADFLPLVHEQDDELITQDVKKMAKKYKIKDCQGVNCVPALTAACLPAVHASLTTQKNGAGFVAKEELEQQLIRRVFSDKFDPDGLPGLITADQQALQLRLIKLEHLKQAKNDVILHQRSVSKQELETAYWTLKDSIHQFLIKRIHAYLKELESGKLSKEIITAHILKLFKTLLDLADPNELADCKVSKLGEDWHIFIDSLDPIEQDKIWQRIAYLSGRAIDLASGQAYAADLGIAAIAHVRAKDYEKADQYYGKLFVAFGDTAEPLEYFNSGVISLALAANYFKNHQPEKVMAHCNTAIVRLNRTIQLIPLIKSVKSFDVLPVSTKILEQTSTEQISAIQHVHAKLKECQEAICKKMEELNNAKRTTSTEIVHFPLIRNWNEFWGIE